jgi:hypothetical protein
MDAGALQSLVALLSTGTNQDKAVAAEALWELAVVGSLRLRIVDGGMLPPLIELTSLRTLRVTHASVSAPLRAGWLERSLR